MQDSNDTIVCRVNTPNLNATALSFHVDTDGALAIFIRSDGTTTSIDLQPEAAAILAAFLRTPAVAERISSAEVRVLSLESPQLGTSMRAPRDMFADLHPE